MKIWTQLIVKVARKEWKKKHPCHISCVLSDAWIRMPQLRSQIQLKYFSEIWPLSQKLCYSRETNFSQCFILSAALHCLLPSSFFMVTIILSNCLLFSSNCLVPLSFTFLQKQVNKCTFFPNIMSVHFHKSNFRLHLMHRDLSAYMYTSLQLMGS